MLRIDTVTKRYGAVAAVDAVSLDIPQGELCTLLGPSGCGKTTLLRIIAGLEQQTSGTMFLHSVDVSHQPPFQRNVGMVFQSYALFPHLTVRANIAYGLHVQQQPRRTINQAVEEVAQLLGIRELLHRQINQLSGGQQQRVALARALVMKPQVLLFDEPLSNLDAKLRRGIREEIRGLQQQFGITAIYVTHDQSEALAISDRVVVMHQGRIVQQGTPQALYSTPNSTFVAQFIGEANLVPVHVTPRGAHGATIRLGAYAWDQPGTIDAAGMYQLVLRPERIMLRAAGPGIPATIRKATFVGAAMEYTLATAWGELFAIALLHGEPPFTVGQAVVFDPQLAQPALVKDAAPLATPATRQNAA